MWGSLIIPALYLAHHRLFGDEFGVQAQVPEVAAHSHGGEFLGGVVGAADEVDALCFGGFVDLHGEVDGGAGDAQHEGVDAKVGEPLVGFGALGGSGHDGEAAVRQLFAAVLVEGAAVADGSFENAPQLAGGVQAALVQASDVDAVLGVPGIVGFASHGP